MWLTLLRRRLARPGKAPQQPAPRRRPAFRPRVEGLEDRITPSGGLLNASWSVSRGLCIVNAEAVQPDGKIVAVGDVQSVQNPTSFALSVVRMNPDGSLDTSFNGTGSTTIKVTNSTGAMAVALQPDGKIIVGGDATVKSGPKGDITEAVVARLNSNGTLDKTFGSKGVWTSTPLGVVAKLTLLSDGSIIGEKQDAVFKLTPAGALNSSFGTGGITTFQSVAGLGAINDLAAMTSGEIVLAGYGYPAGASGYEFGCLVAVTPAGQLDTTFNGTGYLYQNFAAPGWGTNFNAVAVQGNTIVVAGVATFPLPGGSQRGEGVVARYTLTGALDTSFNAYDPITNPNGTPGYFLTTACTYFTAIGLEPDGSLALGGSLHYFNPDGSYNNRALVVHLSAGGVLDTSFGADGTGLVYFDGINGQHVKLSVGPDGSLVICDSSTIPLPLHTGFARFTAP